MRALQVPASAVLAAGLIIGVIGDVLLRAEAMPGLNMFVVIVCMGVAGVLLHRRSDDGLSREAAVSLAVGVVFAAGLVWRGSPALRLIALGWAAVWFALPVLRAGGAWIREAGILGYVAALAAAGGNAAIGTPLTVAAVDWQRLSGTAERQPSWRHAAAVARGLLIALPLIIVFGGLFVSADPVFAAFVTDIVRIDFETIASHVLLTGFVAWVSAGYLHGLLRGTQLPVMGERRPLLTITELGTILGLLNLLFLAFVIVQFRYLFGGSDLVAVTPGLTYAEYARRGFFELVWVVGLTVPLLLVADQVLRRERPRHEVVFRTIAGVLIVLVFAVFASAVQRMRLYQTMYGLTEARFYATAALLTVGAVLLWFTMTVLRGRRRSFAFGTLVISAACAIVLHVINPDALIVRSNIARAPAGPGDIAALDAAYVASLSADAVPVLIDELASVPRHAQPPIARRLLERWPPGTTVPIRAWNWSEARAHREVSANADWLRSMAGAAVTTDAG
ncbi:MAG TPA: DUF4173 domain-containing protein [Longimicrobiales bacterium]|nr:DUF4173 domain-containing protein [Longimicrobiales bacterium]